MSEEEVQSVSLEPESTEPPRHIQPYLSPQAHEWLIQRAQEHMTAIGRNLERLCGEYAQAASPEPVDADDAAKADATALREQIEATLKETFLNRDVRDALADAAWSVLRTLLRHGEIQVGGADEGNIRFADVGRVDPYFDPDSDELNEAGWASRCRWVAREVAGLKRERMASPLPGFREAATHRLAQLDDDDFRLIDDVRQRSGWMDEADRQKVFRIYRKVQPGADTNLKEMARLFGVAVLDDDDGEFESITLSTEDVPPGPDEVVENGQEKQDEGPGV